MQNDGDTISLARNIYQANNFYLLFRLSIYT